MTGCGSWLNLNHDWIWITTESESWLNVDRGWIWIMTGYGSWLNLNHDWMTMWIMTDSESWLSVDHDWIWIMTGCGSWLNLNHDWIYQVDLFRTLFYCTVAIRNLKQIMGVCVTMWMPWWLRGKNATNSRWETYEHPQLPGDAISWWGVRCLRISWRDQLISHLNLFDPRRFHILTDQLTLHHGLMRSADLTATVLPSWLHIRRLHKQIFGDSEHWRVCKGL